MFQDLSSFTAERNVSGKKSTATKQTLECVSHSHIKYSGNNHNYELDTMSLRATSRYSVRLAPKIPKLLNGTP